MEISNYDPLAIDNIPLNVKRSKKYSSVKTLLVSIIIISLDLAINWEHLKEPFLDKSELDILSTIRKGDPANFT